MENSTPAMMRAEQHRQQDIAVARESNICKIRHEGRDGASVFLCRREMRDYRRDLVALAFESGLRLHAYCLLPNEVQLLLGNVSRANLRRMLTRLAARHVYRQCGGDELPEFVFEPAVKLKQLRSDGEVLAAASEIELSPLRRALVARPEHYVWSSYGERALLLKNADFANRVVQPEAAYLDLAAGPVLRSRAYQLYVNARIGTTQQRLLDRAAEAALFESPVR